MAGPEKKFKMRVPKMPSEQKTWTFTLSMPGMITAVGTAMVALTLFFILGLLVGRGYRPEQNVPQLAEIMPKQEHGALVNNGTAPDKVLTPQELTYPETLAQKPVDPAQKAALEKAEEAKQQAAAERKAAQKAGQAAAKTEEKSTVTTAPPAPGDKIYDYTYQAASFRKQAMAEDLRAKLAGAGLNTAIQTAETAKGTWHRVLVNHRGTPDSTNAMKGVLSRFGINKPLMKKKKLFKTVQ